jgi:hypothetical protein
MKEDETHGAHEHDVEIHGQLGAGRISNTMMYHPAKYGDWTKGVLHNSKEPTGISTQSATVTQSDADHEPYEIEYTTQNDI